MKKLTILLMALLMTVGAFAQDARTRTNRQPPESAPPATVTVSGTLALANGRICLQSGEDLYYVTGIQRLVGFVDGLKEGAQVSLEGFTRPFDRTENAKMFFATKLTISGKSYDLAPAGRIGNSPEANGPKQGGNRGPMAGPMGNRGMPCWGSGGPGGPGSGRQGSRNNNRR